MSPGTHAVLSSSTPLAERAQTPSLWRDPSGSRASGMALTSMSSASRRHEPRSPTLADGCGECGTPPMNRLTGHIPSRTDAGSTDQQVAYRVEDADHGRFRSEQPRTGAVSSHRIPPRDSLPGYLLIGGGRAVCRICAPGPLRSPDRVTTPAVASCAGLRGREAVRGSGPTGPSSPRPRRSRGTRSRS